MLGLPACVWECVGVVGVVEVKGVEVKLVEMRGGVLLHPQATPLTEPLALANCSQKPTSNLFSFISTYRR